MEKAHKNINEALSAFQRDVENPTKNATNPHFKNRYADLAAVLNTIREPLAAHGLSVTQTTVMRDGALLLVTALRHVSGGEAISGEYPILPQKPDPQGYGSALTYARRYTLAALLGIAQEDDDGQAASRPVKQDAPAKKPSAKGPPAPMDEDTVIDGKRVGDLPEPLLIKLIDQQRANESKAHAKGDVAWHGHFAANVANLMQLAEAKGFNMPPF